MGATEYVADALAADIEAAGHSATIHTTPKYAELSPSGYWLVCSSTHGAGDLPDNIAPFIYELDIHPLVDIKYWVIGLGDSSYDTFNQAAKTINEALLNQGAQAQAEPLLIDVLESPIPEDDAQAWWQTQLATLWIKLSLRR